MSDQDELFILEEVPSTSTGPTMSMMTWMNTEGGRKCLQCGRYARSSEIGYTGFRGPGYIVDNYGHLPGFGCNIQK